MKNSPSRKPRPNGSAGRAVKLAIFDIDGTIFRSSLIIEVFNALVVAGIFPKTASQLVERNYLRWLNRKGHYNDYLMTLVYTYYRYLPGKQARRVDAIISRVILWQKDRVYRFTRDLLHSLKAKGYLLLAISNSPHAMVERFAATQGFDGTIGRILEVKNGRYTGRILYNGKPFPINATLDKVAILHDWLSAHGIRADLARSWAVGDSEGDMALLSAVGRPIAFNPSAGLAEAARERGWQIVVERKDVMYLIQEAGMITAQEKQHIHVHHTPRARRKKTV